MKIETVLRERFPMLRTKESVLNELSGNPKLLKKYNSLSEKLKTEYINMCTGA